MFKWFKKQYRAARITVLRIAAAPFKAILAITRTLRNAADAVSNIFDAVSQFFHNGVYWSLDMIQILEDAAKK